MELLTWYRNNLAAAQVFDARTHEGPIGNYLPLECPVNYPAFAPLSAVQRQSLHHFPNGHTCFDCHRKRIKFSLTVDVLPLPAIALAAKYRKRKMLWR